MNSLWEDWNEEDYFAPAYNVYGVACGTWEEACLVAGIETPAQIDAEIAWETAEERIAEQDRIEAQGPTFRRFGTWGFDLDDDLPF